MLNLEIEVGHTMRSISLRNMMTKLETLGLALVVSLNLAKHVTCAYPNI
jgi:hypothetical protein